ncbi:superoxide dismutase [Actinoplanes sp. NPDC026619]|uniref:superoxide dismutase n=1 Tax=Actinoplanes sp. NPDC026619 TaxID=3155798 RepID=UPI0033C2F3A7
MDALSNVFSGAFAPAGSRRLTTGASGSAPRTIDLPRGFAPEGIAIAGSSAYLTSRVSGAIYRVGLTIGAGGSELIQAGGDAPANGVKIDGRGRAFLSGGGVRVLSVATGELLETYRIGGAFINDVALTRDAAWFTDAFGPTLYRLPIAANGTLGAELTALPLTGITITAGTVNLNGICATPDGRALLVVQSNTGWLFRADPATGAATRVNLGGVTLVNGDGLLLEGSTLYVVRNRSNAVEVFTLNRPGTAGTHTTTLTGPGFAVPTAAAALGSHLYVVNSKLTTPITPDIRYDIVAIRRP